jgi:hypothetical protein
MLEQKQLAKCINTHLKQERKHSNAKHYSEKKKQQQILLILYKYAVFIERCIEILKYLYNEVI